MAVTLKEASESISNAIREASRGLIERETLTELIVLSAVAQEHLLVIGPPGTAKSAVVRRVAQALGGKYYEYLLGRFTEPSEIFGPVDLKKLRDGTVETETREMLPEAEIAFLDEVFLGSTAILNTLLALLNERVFRRGHTNIVCPLRVCVGASNALPDDIALEAFADRFLSRVFVSAVPDHLLEDLMEGGRAVSTNSPGTLSSIQHLDVLAASARTANFSQITPVFAHSIRLLRKAGILMYDRRIVKCQSLVAAATALAGRVDPTEADLWPLIYAIPTLEGQQLGREVLGSILQTSENSALVAASEDASASPQARAARLVRWAEELLELQPPSAEEREIWSLKVEALGREIDAGFAESTMPEDLKSVRTRVASALG
jgi:MoxR-like ATPase